MSEYILETEDLTKEFAGFVAVNGVNLRVERGTIHALIGPNGAGKTTCFNLLTKFLQPTRGRITYKGADITALPPAEVARLGMVRSFQISAVFPHLTVLENVRIALQRQRGGSFDFWRSSRVLERVQRAGAVADRRRRPVRCRRRPRRSNCRTAESARWRSRPRLALDPEMLLLDEPTAGMGHEDIERITALIKRVAADRTVLMVEHNLSVVENLCQRITVLTRGRVLAEGDYATVAEQSRGARKPTWGRAMLDVRAPLLSVKDLQAWYGELHILHGVSFDVHQGEVVTLLGRNGAGKTTTLKSIMGIVGQRAGSVRFEGRELIGTRLQRDRARRHRVLPGGARHLREPDRRGEPAAAAAR